LIKNAKMEKSHLTEDVIREAREDTYRDILEISEGIKNWYL